MSNEINNLREIKNFRLNAERKVLYFKETPLDIPLKEIELLCVLTENAGELVTKEELLDSVWKDSFIEESNLSRHVYRLRQMFESYGETDEIIQTVRGRGYRFAASMSQDESAKIDLIETRETKPLVNVGELPKPIEIRAKVGWNYRKVIFATFAVLLITVVGFAGYRYFKPKPLVDSLFNKTKTERVPVTGILFSTAISPDGKYLAYVGEAPTKRGIIMLRQLETGIEKELVNLPDCYFEIREFSPDGNYLYFDFVRTSEAYSRFKRIAVLGGEIQDIPSDTASEVGVSPDGKKTVFYRWINNDEAQQIIVADIETKAEKVVYTTHGNFIVGPQFSPDGTKIAFLYAATKNEVYKTAMLGYVSVDGGEITRIGNSLWKTQIASWRILLYYYFRWLSDGSGILIAQSIEGEDNYQLFKIGFPDGKVSRLTEDNADYATLTLTADNKTLATVKKLFTNSIWEYDLQTKKAKQLTQPSNLRSGETGIATTDENKILFCQIDGNGNGNLMQMDADGSNIKTLVAGKGRISVPIVSADGKYVFFSTNVTDRSSKFPVNDIWQANIDGSNVRQLNVPADGIQFLSGVSPDNRNLLKLDNINDIEHTKARMYNLDSGKTLPIADDDSLVLFRIDLSPNGKQILYATYPKARNGIENNGTTFSLADFDGVNLKQPPQIFPRFWSPQFLWGGRFAPDGKSIYYLPFTNPNEIRNVDIVTGKSTEIENFTFAKLYNFAVSRDGRKLYIVFGNTTDEVLLIKNAE